MILCILGTYVIQFQFFHDLDNVLSDVNHTPTNNCSGFYFKQNRPSLNRDKENGVVTARNRKGISTDSHFNLVMNI